MSTSALIFMAVVWTVIIGMTGYCFWKILSAGRPLGGDDPPLSDMPETGITERPRQTDITE